MVRATGTPEVQDHVLVRSDEVLRLIDQVAIAAAPTTLISRDVECGPYRRFSLYLRVKSTSTPTTVQFIVEFLDPNSTLWHSYLQGLFASLVYEDTVTATERDEVYEGLCLGRRFRVRAVGTGTTAAAYFTVSVAVEFFN